jgi:outer membrane protein assembly factor BamD
MPYLFLLLLPLLFAGCSGTKTSAPRTADYYLTQGEQLFDQGHYEEAITNWEKVRDSYYSPELNLIAEMKIAEAYFLAEKYPEATAAYEDYLKQHPNDSRVPDALYHLALSYYNQIRPADRDQTATRNALVTFRDLRKRFPQDNRNAAAKGYIDHCLDRLAAHEVAVAYFYLRTDRYLAAISRIEGMLKTYPNYPDRDEAFLYLGQAYQKSGQKEQAIATFNTLLSQFGNSSYAAKARKALRDYYQ